MPDRPSAANAAVAPHPLISNERLRHLYTTLLRARLLRQRNPLRGPAPLVAREAVLTGTVTHLEKDDTVMPLPGDQVAALARGHSIRRVLRGGSLSGMLAAAAAPEVRFAIATGYARAQQASKQIVLAFSGPGVTSLDGLRSSLAYAALEKLGIVFVIETAAEAEVSSARRTEPLGLYGIPVDGNDVIAIYRVAQEAIQRARRGVGPTIIDCKPWPLASTKDAPTDPVRRLEQALEPRGLEIAKLKQRTIAGFRRELAAAGRKPRPTA
ncbi:MAG TPA: thiamine pyrophosphate-dependent enzyme [Acidobacteriaceae bacterium]